MVAAGPLLLALLAVVVAVFFFLRQRRSEPMAGKRVPQVGSRVPLFGNALAYRPDPKAYLAKCREQYGDVFELKLGSLRNVVLLGSEHSKLFFRAGEDLLSFEKALKAINFGLFLDEKTFSFPVHITLLKQKFIPNMKNWTPLIESVIRPTFIEAVLTKLGTPHWKDGQKGTMLLDVERFTYEIVARSSARCVCGPDHYQNEELIRTFIDFDKDAVEMIGLSTILPSFLHRFLGGKVKNHYNVMQKHLLPTVKKRRAELKSAEQVGQELDYLSYLLGASDPEGAPLSDEWIVSRMGVVIWASLTTTANALHLTLANIFSRPEIKAKVLEEQKQVLGKSKGVGYEQVKQMNYLEAAIRESLRVSGAILGPTRMAMQDIQAGEFNIPKGTLVSLSMNFTHHLKELWGDDVDKFRPERFLGQDTQPPYAFIPFGSGLHACPGRSFAIHEITTTIALFLRSYDIDLPDGPPTLIWLPNKVTTKKQPFIFTRNTEEAAN